MSDHPHKSYDEAPQDTPRASEPMTAYQAASGRCDYAASLYRASSRSADDADRIVRNRMTYMVYCVNAFAEQYHLSPKQAFAYLHRFKGLDFLDECYEAEHQLSIRDAVNDLAVICKRNGGSPV